jgi:hypothetical protein
MAKGLFSGMAAAREPAWLVDSCAETKPEQLGVGV